VGHSKTSSPIRRGFEYQDLTALSLALELFVENTDFRIYLEYGKPSGLDDIIVARGSEIHAYQVKHAENPLDAFRYEDFIENTDKRVHFGKFSAAWKDLRKRFPTDKITCHLLSNRSVDSTFTRIVDHRGCFTSQFIENKLYKEPRNFRAKLKEICNLEENEFRDFLASFRFDLNQRSLSEIEDLIKGSLLDHKLGIYEPSVFHELLDQIRKFSTERDDALTVSIFNRILQETENRYLLPQKFTVDYSSFVQLKTLTDKLDHMLSETNGEYIVVTGLPGSGKSTCLSVYLDSVEKKHDFVVVRYYCFVNVNDNRQKRRLEAQSLRINILSELQRNFSHILDRRFDFSGENFFTVLETLGKQFGAKGQKLVVFLDGLDHAERDGEVLQNVLTTLPREIPKGVIFLIGTQELQRWQPLALKQGREGRHISMPLFSLIETREFFERHGFFYMNERLKLIHKKSEGLPLYLKYVVQLLQEYGEDNLDIETLPPAEKGEIRTYYESLWAAFEGSGRGKAKYLCEVAACLNFKVHVEEFFSFQNEVPRTEFEDSFRAIRHLLRIEDLMMSIFHNSFRVFLLSRIDGGLKTEIIKIIATKLRAEKGGPRWYEYAFEYAFNAGEHKYILQEVNKKFVDNALVALRPNDDIIKGIGWAVEAARTSSDLVAMARLGPLHYRTNERLEHLNRSLLAKVLLHLGRKEEVVGFSCVLQDNRWLVSNDVALDLIIWCAETGNNDLGSRLFKIFTGAFRPKDELQREEIVKIGRCLGLYGLNVGRNLRWLSHFQMKRDSIVADADYFAPAYEPHFAAYVDAAVQFRDDGFWQRLKRIKKLIPSNVIRYFIIRSIANHKSKEVLGREIREYIQLYPNTPNLELAVYAAKAGLPSPMVRSIAGTLPTPPAIAPQRISGREYALELRTYMMAANILSYEGSRNAIKHIQSTLNPIDSYWKRIVLFAVKAGRCIGEYHAGSRANIFLVACEALEDLAQATQAEGERIIEIHEGFRLILPEALCLLTEAIVSKAPTRLSAWAEKLLSIRESEVWKIHYGIGESIQDYSFELAVWDMLADVKQFRPYFHNILKQCYKTYLTATRIKGGSRSQHFLWLAAIAAKCGFKSDAEKWIQTGVEATNIYGYHKDITLSRLIDVLELLNKYQPEKALSRCAAVLEMIKWMGSLTDWRETKWFPQQAFSLVLKASRAAALDLVGFYSKHSGRWNMLDCVEEYICSREQGDPDFLWVLCELFASNFSEPERHPKQVIRARKHVAHIASSAGGPAAAESWSERLHRFIRTSLTPRSWPEEIWEASLAFETRPERDKEEKESKKIPGLNKYILDGEEKSIQEIKNLCLQSFSKFLEAMEKLKKENQYFWDRSFTNEALSYHTTNTHNIDELMPIKEYVAQQGISLGPQIARQLGQKFLEFGDVKNACACFEIAFSSTEGWYRYKEGSKDLQNLKIYDEQRLKDFLIDKCYQNLQVSYGGFDVPAMVATGFEIFADIISLESVFNDYLQHCQELFSHLPDEHLYDWLRDYGTAAKDENSQITNLLIDELATQEIDLGERLIKAFITLATDRSDIVWPIILSKLAGAADLQMGRLLSAIEAILLKKPELLLQDWNAIWTVAKNSHFRHRIVLIRVLDRVFRDGSMPSVLQDEIAHFKRNYSSIICVSTYRLLYTKPSNEFLEFLKKGALLDFNWQLEGVTDVLKLDKDSVLADLERRLRSQGWNVKDAQEQREEDWDGNVHAQGWPVIWIVPRFHTQISVLLYSAIEEYMEKMKFQDWQLEATWRIIQPSDPEFLRYAIHVKPDDIAPLFVKDKATWFQELAEHGDIVVSGLPSEGWVCLFESRYLSQDTKYEVPYKNQF